jgi:hypothetical protein
MTTLPLQLKRKIHTPQGNMVKKWIFPFGGHAFATVLLPSDASPTTTSRVPCLEAFRRARIPSLLADPSVLALRSNQGTWHFCGEPPQTLQTRCSLHTKLLLTWPPRRPDSMLVLWSKPTKPHVQTPVVSHYPALTPLFTASSCFSCHHAARTWSRSATRSLKLSLLISPHLGGPFTHVLHLHKCKSSCNLHLQYSAKS